MRLYLVMLVPTAAVNLAGLPCPLTVWEKHFWRLAGETPYRGGFISQYFVEPFYAPGLRPGDETVLLVLVVVWCLLWLLYSATRPRRPRTAELLVDVQGGQLVDDVEAPEQIEVARCGAAVDARGVTQGGVVGDAY